MLKKMRDTMRAMTVEDVVNLEANLAAQLTSEQREELERMVEEMMGGWRDRGDGGGGRAGRREWGGWRGGAIWGEGGDVGLFPPGGGSRGRFRLLVGCEEALYYGLRSIVV